MGQLIYLKNVVTLQLDKQKCSGCGLCAIVCPHRVLEIVDKKAAIIERDLCMECGACMRNCSSEALSVRAGVGCANAVINTKLNRKGDCCCNVETC